MIETTRKRRVHADRLREIGFPEKAISEAVRRKRAGLFDMEPSDGLVRRTIAKLSTPIASPQARRTGVDGTGICCPVRDQGLPLRRRQVRLTSMLDDVPVAAVDAVAWGGVSRLERLQG